MCSTIEKIRSLLDIKSILVNVSHDIIIYSSDDMFYDYTVCMTWTAITKKGKQVFSQELWFVDEESRNNFKIVFYS